MSLINYSTIFQILMVCVALSWSETFAESTGAINISSKPANDEFDRLFTNQYERNAIDRARLTGGFIPAPVTGVDENLVAPSYIESVRPIKLLGVLLRADGKNKVWMSGGTEPQQKLISSRAITGSIQQSANVKVGVNNGTILKPGQVWSVVTGRQESYQIPAPKPVVVEAAPIVQKQPSSATSSSMQVSSVSSSEVSSSVQSSTK